MTNMHASNVTEIINRNVVVTLLLEQGYNVFLPVYDDGIDFIIHRRSDDHVLKVQLKSRWTIDRKYVGRDISIAFPHAGSWYLASHDEMVKLAPAKALESSSWQNGGAYSSAAPSKETMERLAAFRLRRMEEVASESAVAGEAVKDDQATNRAFFEWLREWKKTLPPQPPITVDEILEMRDEGRRY